MEKPSRNEVVNAIKTIIRYIGDDPDREGLKETPDRVVRSYDELYSGYSKDGSQILNKVFCDRADFHDFIILRNISFNSICEHHMLPFIGKVDIAYVPNDVIIGISKLPRIVEVFARRLQLQEKMTSDIAEEIQAHLNPEGVAVRISAKHYCMSMRGVEKSDVLMETLHFTGAFKTNKKHREEFLSLLK